MFSDVIAFPIDLLRNAAVWNKSIEKLMPLPAFKVYRFIIRYIFVYVAVVCETVHLKAFESFEIFCDNFSIAASISNISFKMFAMYTKIDDVHGFINDMDSGSFRPRDREEHKMLHSTLNYARSINRLWFFSITGTSVMAPIVPILQMKRILPLHFWYPFPVDLKNDYIFYPFYVHQALTSLILGQIAAATGTFIFSSLVYLNYQLKLLGYRLSQCGYDEHMSNDIKHTQFIECIKVHLEIKELVQKFENIFNLALFVQIGQSVLVYSMLTVLMTSIEMASTAFLSKLCHLAAMILEMGVLCFFSNEILYSSQSLSVRAYFSNIVACDIKTGRALIMFMRDSDFQPIAIRANGIFKFLLNFQLFLSILRTTYSYVSMSMAMRRH